MKRIIKLILAWIDWKELKRQIAGEKKYAVGLSLLIFLVVFVLMVAISKHDYNRIFERQNYLERRMNSFDTTIQETLIKNENL